jgi:hypothetical protein
MANVLSKAAPHIYLESVNTPEYPEVDWVINPDLSSVTTVPQHYWAIDTTPAVPEVQEVLDVDGITVLVPYSPYVPEINVVREMTVGEKATYDAAHPAPVDTSKLTNGMPAFYDTTRSIVRSINEREVIFATKTNGSKNFYLNADDGIASNVRGYPIINANIIVLMAATIQEPVTEPVTFELRKNGTATIIQTLVIPIGSTTIADSSINITCSPIDELSCNVTCTVNVINPTVRLSLSFINP